MKESEKIVSELTEVARELSKTQARFALAVQNLIRRDDYQEDFHEAISDALEVVGNAIGNATVEGILMLQDK